MREITTHRVSRVNEAVVVEAGEPGPGGAPLTYTYELRGGPRHALHFVSETTTGLTNEALLAVVIDRLQGFQRGPHPCRENAVALTHLETALLWLGKRFREREAGGAHEGG